MKTTSVVALVMGCLALSACGENELSQCIASTEQTILLRQMALPTDGKAQFELCLQKTRYGAGYCKALWLNADTAVEGCMAQNGYSFTNTDSGFGFCGYSDWENSKCYRSKWVLMLPAELRNHLFRPYNPME